MLTVLILLKWLGMELKEECILSLNRPPTEPSIFTLWSVLSSFKFSTINLFPTKCFQAQRKSWTGESDIKLLLELLRAFCILMRSARNLISCCCNMQHLNLPLISNIWTSNYFRFQISGLQNGYQKSGLITLYQKLKAHLGL